METHIHHLHTFLHTGSGLYNPLQQSHIVPRPHILYNISTTLYSLQPLQHPSGLVSTIARFRQRDLATSRVAQLACYSLREVPRTPDVAPPVCYVLTQEEDRGRRWVSFDFSGSILRVLRDSAPPLPKMLWPWRRGPGFVTATCHMHAVCVYSPSALGRSPTPLGRPGSFVGRGGPSSLGIHFGSRGSGHV